MSLFLDDDTGAAEEVPVFTNKFTDRIDICPCTSEGTLMELCTNDSQFICPKCNAVSKVENYTVIDQTNLRLKADSKAWRIFNTYWQPIIGTEEWAITDMDTADYKKLIDYLDLNGYSTAISRRQLGCNTIRKYIKDLRLPNALNQHITKILIHFGVAEPYQPTSEETDRVFRWYLEAINTYETIKDKIANIIPGSKPRDNNITRTFYLYKIIDANWRTDKNMRSLLAYIHLQHSKTIEANDLIWEQICEIIKLPYFPTERTP